MMPKQLLTYIFFKCRRNIFIIFFIIHTSVGFCKFNFWLLVWIGITIFSCLLSLLRDIFVIVFLRAIMFSEIVLCNFSVNTK